MIVTLADLDTHFYDGILTAITEDNDAIAQSALDAAIAEAKGYCSLYDVDLLFNGSTVDAILKMRVKDMAKWHLITLSNPNVEYQDALDRYEQALRWLREVQAGKVVPPGWPARTIPTGLNTYFSVSSRRAKRRNDY
jgi:phage gp36-like protein